MFIVEMIGYIVLSILLAIGSIVGTALIAAIIFSGSKRPDKNDETIVLAWMIACLVLGAVLANIFVF